MWFPETLYTIDILFAVFVVFFVVCGTRHGLSGELAHVVTLLALLAGFCFFYPQIIQFASDNWRVLPPTVVRIAVPTALLLAALLLFLLVRALFKQLLKSKLGEATDKIAGGLAGAVRGAVLGLAVFIGLSMIPNESLYQAISEKSSIGGWACKTLTPRVQPRINELPVLKNKMNKHLDDIIQ